MLGATAVKAATVRRDQLVVHEPTLVAKAASVVRHEIRTLLRIRVQDGGAGTSFVLSFAYTLVSPLCALLRILTLSLVLVLLVLGPLVAGGW